MYSMCMGLYIQYNTGKNNTTQVRTAEATNVSIWDNYIGHYSVNIHMIGIIHICAACITVDMSLPSYLFFSALCVCIATHALYYIIAVRQDTIYKYYLI